MTPNKHDTRARKIGAGKLWQIERKATEEVVFEGSRARCYRWLQINGEMRRWKSGKSEYSLGQLIWEK